MCKSKQIIRLNKIIKKRSDKYYYNNPVLCAKHNLYVRCEVFIKKKKEIWPPLKPEEIREFITITRFPIKYFKNEYVKK